MAIAFNLPSTASLRSTFTFLPSIFSLFAFAHAAILSCPALHYLSFPSSRHTHKMPNAALELSHAIDLFLYKDRSSYFDRLSVATDSLDSQNATAPLALPSFRWDMQATCKPMLPAFQYISHKLSQRGIAAALIISQFEPYIIPIVSYFLERVAINSTVFRG